MAFVRYLQHELINGIPVKELSETERAALDREGIIKWCVCKKLDPQNRFSAIKYHLRDVDERCMLCQRVNDGFQWLFVDTKTGATMKVSSLVLHMLEWHYVVTTMPQECGDAAAHKLTSFFSGEQ